MLAEWLESSRLALKIPGLKHMVCGIFQKLSVHPTVYGYLPLSVHPTVYGYLPLSVHPTVYGYLPLSVHPTVNGYLTLSVHPTVNGYLTLFRDEADKGDEDKEWPPIPVTSVPVQVDNKL